MSVFRRLALVPAAALIVFLSSILAAGGGPPSRADSDGLRIGISFGNTLPRMSDDQLGEALDAAAGAGARWIRADVSWADIQPSSPDEFVWDSFDRTVEQARRHGLQVLPILAYTPPWARSPGCRSDHCPPADPARFAAFAGAAAARYGPQGIHTWEVWNEPNFADYWLPAADPSAYARLLALSSQALRAADPKAYVILGGLATLKTDAGNVSVADFLTRPAESPLKYVDAVAIHPYTYPYPAGRLSPWASPWAPADSGMPYLRSALAAAGAPGIPLWITEYGAPTGGPGPVWDGSPDSLAGGPDHVTETQQAQIATDAVATAASDPGIAALFWYTDRDLGNKQDDTEAHYGLRRVDGSQKPAYGAFRDAVARRRD